MNSRDATSDPPHRHRIVPAAVFAMMPNHMYFLRKLFWALAVALFLAAAVLLFLPRLIPLEAHLRSLLDRFNRNLPFQLSIQRAQLTFLPFVGLRLEEARLLRPSFHAADAQVRLDPSTAFQDMREVAVHVPKAELTLTEVADGAWDFFPALPNDRPLMGRLHLTGLVFASADVTLRPLNSPAVHVKAQAASVTLRPVSLLVEARWPGPLSPVGNDLARCENMARPAEESVLLDVSRKGIHVRRWQLEGGLEWSGDMGWDGRITLKSPKGKVSGTPGASRCLPAGRPL
jgi:hypothetical protein